MRKGDSGFGFVSIWSSILSVKVTPRKSTIKFLCIGGNCPCLIPHFYVLKRNSPFLSRQGIIFGQTWQPCSREVGGPTVELHTVTKQTDGRTRMSIPPTQLFEGSHICDSAALPHSLRGV